MYIDCLNWNAFKRILIILLIYICTFFLDYTAHVVLEAFNYIYRLIKVHSFILGLVWFILL